MELLVHDGSLWGWLPAGTNTYRGQMYANAASVMTTSHEALDMIHVWACRRADT